MAIILAAIAGFFEHLGRVGQVALALGVAVPVACQILAAITWMRDSDEFFRAMSAKRFTWQPGWPLPLRAPGAAKSAPHISAAMVYPLFWVAFGLVTPFVRSTRV